MTTEWMDKPDGDGWFDVCSNDGIPKHAIAVRGGRCAYFKIDGKPITSSDWDVSILVAEGKKFRRMELPVPPPYVAPKPPVVQQYTAKFNGDGKHRFLTRVGTKFVATYPDGKVSNWDEWSFRERNYYDIKEIEAT